MNRPAQRTWSKRELDALPAKVDVPTAASVLGVGAKTLRGLFNGSRVAHVQVGDQEVEVAGFQLGRQLWVVTDSLRRIFDARAP